MIIINETKQSFFDKVVEHLAQQGRVAEENGSCKYRTSEGLKCAFGIFIPDEAYPIVEPFEGLSISRLEELGVIKFTGEVELIFASTLQRVHDSSPDLPEMKEWLFKIAQREKLDSSKIELIKSWDGRMSFPSAPPPI